MKTNLIPVILLNIFMLASLQNLYAQNPNNVCTQTINLYNNLLDVFANLINNGNLEHGIAFDNGTITYNPNIPFPWFLPFDLEDGFGYWVKVQNSDVLTVEGTCIADDFLKPLDVGWNLIAYPPDDPQSPATYFADLISNGDLEFVMGFDGEIKIFDPNQPAFLNTLQQLENGHGYWIKVTNASN